MAREYKPLAYQPAMVGHLLKNPRCALFVFMGAGKTVTTLTAIDTLQLLGELKGPVLVLGPLRVVRTTWVKEAAEWQHLQHLRVVSVTGSREERIAALQTGADVYCMNYDNLSWLEEYYRDPPVNKEYQSRWPFRMVVADESTKLKGFRSRQGSVRAQALGRVAHRFVDRFVCLTGTPAPNGLESLWGQMWFLDAGARLGRSFSSFTARWFQTLPGGDGYTRIRPLAHAQEEITARLQDVCLSIDAKDYFTLDEPIYTRVLVELPPKALALYREMERNMFIELEGLKGGVEAFSAGAKTMKALQLASGCCYVDPKQHEDGAAWVEVHDEKLQALDDILEEAGGMPVIICYQFKSELARLIKRYPQGREFKGLKVENDFKAGKIPYLFLHPASAGHGVDGLQKVTNIMVFLGHQWSLELRQQVIERIGPVRQMQAGFKRSVFIYDIVAKGTLDEQVLLRHQTKADVQTLLLEAMKERRDDRVYP